MPAAAFTYQPLGTAASVNIRGIHDPADLRRVRSERRRYDLLVGTPQHTHAAIQRGAHAVEAVHGQDAGDQYVTETARVLKAAKVPIAFDDDEIEFRAHAAAGHCLRASSDAAAIEFCRSRGIDPPKGRNVTARSARRRLNDPRWWRRRYRAHFTRAAENAFRQVGQVHRHASAYITRDGLERYTAQRRRSAQFLAASDVVCVETGELFPLDAIAEKSIANPAIRRGELMVRARGFQEVAEARGDRGLFLTLTCPSAFHARLEKTGDLNPRWTGATVRAGQEWLCKMWARARAKLKRLSIDYYGFRVAEPHHDATPHWHAVLYCAPHHVDTFCEVIRAAWLAEYRDEPGAAEARVKFKVEDPAVGSGVGYIAKYVAKNIDAHGGVGSEASDETGGEVSESVAAAVAWSRVHGIRQFQQLGGPVVTLWRELRRLRDVQEAPALEALRAPTDKTEAGGPSWSRFVDALGGIAVAREASRGHLEREQPTCTDTAGREVLRLTEYGELPEPRAVGVRALSVKVERLGDQEIRIERWVRARTRLYRWRQVRRQDSAKRAVPVVNPQGTGETGADRPAALVPSSLFLPLGPVGITIRGGSCACVECSTGNFSPYRPERYACRAGP